MQDLFALFEETEREFNDGEIGFDDCGNRIALDEIDAPGEWLRKIKIFDDNPVGIALTGFGGVDRYARKHKCK